MEFLNTDPVAHVTMAEAFATAKDSKTEAQAAEYYRFAMEEYEKAIQLDSTNVHALNGYAYTFWERRVRWPTAQFPDAPHFTEAQQAEKYARQAVKLATGKLGLQLEAMTRSTLGEVLLGQARPEEAIEELQKAIAIAPQHPFFDEMRWTWPRPTCAQVRIIAKDSVRVWLRPSQASRSAVTSDSSKR